MTSSGPPSSRWTFRPRCSGSCSGCSLPNPSVAWGMRRMSPLRCGGWAFTTIGSPRCRRTGPISTGRASWGASGSCADPVGHSAPDRAGAGRGAAFGGREWDRQDPPRADRRIDGGRAGIVTVTANCTPETVRRPLGMLQQPLASIAELTDHQRQWGSAAGGSRLRNRGASEPLLGVGPGRTPGPVRAVRPSEIQDRLQRDLGRLFERLGPHTPVLMALDDLQWSDESSIRCLDALIRGGLPERVPLVILGTYRAEEVTPEIESLRDAPGLRDLSLGPLTRNAVDRLTADMLALSSTPPRLLDCLVGESEGSPQTRGRPETEVTGPSGQLSNRLARGSGRRPHAPGRRRRARAPRSPLSTRCLPVWSGTPDSARPTALGGGGGTPRLSRGCSCVEIPMEKLCVWDIGGGGMQISIWDPATGDVSGCQGDFGNEAMHRCIIEEIQGREYSSSMTPEPDPSARLTPPPNELDAATPLGGGHGVGDSVEAGLGRSGPGSARRGQRGCCAAGWRPQRDSNPCCHLERVES